MKFALCAYLAVTTLSVSAFATVPGALPGDSEICDFMLTTLNAVTQSGPYQTHKLNESVIVKVAQERLNLSVDANGVGISVAGSKYAANEFRVFESYLEAITNYNVHTMRDPNFRRQKENSVKVTGHVYYVVHPQYGLMAIDASGVVLRLPEEVATLKPENIKTVLTFKRLFRGSETIVITNDGLAYPLYEGASRWDGWPMFTTRRLIVNALSGDPTNVSNYQFIHLSEFDLRQTVFKLDTHQSTSPEGPHEYVGYEDEDTLLIDGIYAKFSASTEGHQRNLINIDSQGKPQILFTYSRGFGIWDINSKTFIEKPLAIDEAIPVNMSVRAIFDLKDMNRVAIVTGSGHLRLVNRADLLDPGKPTFDFVYSKRGRAEQGDFANFGHILSARTVKGISDVVELEVLDGGLSSREHGPVYQGTPYSVAIYHLKVNADGTSSLTKVRQVSQGLPQPIAFDGDPHVDLSGN